MRIAQGKFKTICFNFYCHISFHVTIGYETDFKDARIGKQNRPCHNKVGTRHSL